MSEPAHEPESNPHDPSAVTATTDEDLLAALADDFAARARRNERPSVEEYVAKHPALAERIRTVLQAISLIEESRTVDLATAGEGPGSTIGRYKLLERVGEGGFGVVFMAEQHQPVRRRVALKIIKAGMDTRQVVARFEAERQALAIMDHPNIAKVFDGGVTDAGRPYFVMELVKGEPITEYCDRNQLAPRQRLELFAQVCHAVQHAHQKGIIHRDIKPTNVLVMTHDTTPRVKVIDFGVAKALGQELTEKTLFTGFAQLLGTPLYMSPEQAGESALDVDTRSDIYSLGVLLYELLTGTTPFEKERFKRAAQDEIRRIIREEEPPRPSTRLSDSKDRLPSISAQRHTEPGKLTRLVRGELDWIVMKALEKDRARRYETANGFAADVRRYLDDEPVQACPPSTGYRLKKFARRNKATLVTASVVCVALLFAVGSFGWAVRGRAVRHAKVAGQVELILAEVDRLEGEQKWPEALAAARQAEAAVAGGEADEPTARRVRERLKGLEFVDRLERIRMQRATWVGRAFDSAGADRDYGRAFRDYGADVEALAAEAAIERLKARPALAIPLAAALDDWSIAHWVATGDAESATRMVAVARGVDPEPLRDRLRATRGKPASEVGDELRRLAESIDVRAQHPATLDVLAIRLRRVGRQGDALRLMRDAQRAHPGEFWLSFNLAHQLGEQKDYEGAVRFYTAAVSVRPRSTAALNNLGNVLRNRGNPAEAAAAFGRAIELDPGFAYAHNGLGLALLDRKQLDEAVAAFREAIKHDPKADYAYDNLGNALSDQKRFAEAVAAYRKAIELDPKDTKHHSNLGTVLCDKLRDYEGAAACFRKAIELDPGNASAHCGLGVALYGQNKPVEAVAAYRKAIELDPGQALYHRNLGDALSGQNQPGQTAYMDIGSSVHPQVKPDEAVAAYREAIKLDPKDAAARRGLAGVLFARGERDEVATLMHECIRLDPDEPAAHYILGLVLFVQQKWEAAVREFREAARLDPDDYAAQYNLGCALREMGKWAEAADAFRHAVRLNPKYADAHNNLGAALRELSEWEGAADAFLKAIRLSPDNPMPHFNLGITLIELRRWAEAADALRQAIRIRPDDAEAHDKLGAALAEQGQWKQAADAFREVLRLDPDHATARENLARVLRAQADEED